MNRLNLFQRCAVCTVLYVWICWYGAWNSRCIVQDAASAMFDLQWRINLHLFCNVQYMTYKGDILAIEYGFQRSLRKIEMVCNKVCCQETFWYCSWANQKKKQMHFVWHLQWSIIQVMVLFSWFLIYLYVYSHWLLVLYNS